MRGIPIHSRIQPWRKGTNAYAHTARIDRPRRDRKSRIHPPGGGLTFCVYSRYRGVLELYSGARQGPVSEGSRPGKGAVVADLTERRFVTPNMCGIAGFYSPGADTQSLARDLSNEIA